jgi:phenylpyruvate tautomerase PptA (4-oxalocrotonate tautomerase family)
MNLEAAALILSGWVDLTITSPSYEENREKDVFFSKAGVEWLAANILAEGTDRRDPLISPLFADDAMPVVFIKGPPGRSKKAKKELIEGTLRAMVSAYAMPDDRVYIEEVGSENVGHTPLLAVTGGEGLGCAVGARANLC